MYGFVQCGPIAFCAVLGVQIDESCAFWEWQSVQSLDRSSAPVDALPGGIWRYGSSLEDSGRLARCHWTELGKNCFNSQWYVTLRYL